MVGCGIPAAAIVYTALCHEAFFVRRFFALPVLLGDASYSIYLSHLSVLALIKPPLVGLYAAVLGGLLVYLAVEKPLLDWRKRAVRFSEVAKA